METISSKTLSSLIPNLKSVLDYHSYIVKTALRKISILLPEITLVEYGGGLGFQSLVAKQLGVGTVVYIDIDPKMVELAEEIAEEAGLKADHYICGDQDGLVEAGIKADIITSNDVLEHIYNIEYFLEGLSLICNKGATLILNSGANMFWYPYAKHSAILQKQAEYEGVPEYNSGPFLQERESMIRGWYTEFGKTGDIEALGAWTRGLAGTDIKEAVGKYLRSGELPSMIDHPTNTCNPYTGNWAEASMNPFCLAEILRSVGFEAEIRPVPFEKVDGRVNNLVRRSLNGLMRFAGNYYGLCFSCRYSIQARYTGLIHTKHLSETLYKHTLSPVYYLVAIPYELVSLIYPRRSYYSSQFGSKDKR